MNKPLLIFTCMMLLAMASCSGGDGPVTPYNEPALPTADSNHACWGLWQMIADPVGETLEAFQLHSGQGHLNVIVFLEPPPFVNLTLDYLEFNGDEVIADIGLRHPFLGLDEFTGFDVSGILISNGSYASYGSTGIRHAGPGDTYLMNPDGYSRYWNPDEFPHNPSSPVDGYNDGLLGAPDSHANYNTNINGYKYYTEGLTAQESIESVDPTSRGYFAAGQKNVRRFHIKIGPPGLIFNYAIDACWVPPTTSPPGIDVPDDFPPEANRSEPWRITVAEIENGLWWNGTTGGGDLTLEVHVWDWFGIEDITIGLTPYTVTANIGVPSQVLLDTDLGHAAFEIEMTDFIITGNDSIPFLIQAFNGDTGFEGHVPGEPDAAYNIHWTDVGDNQPPVALAEATSPTGISIGGTVDFDATASYDPDGTIEQYLWDFDGDGNYGDTNYTGDPETPTATFDTAGTFDVDLKVIDNVGLEDTLDETIEVYVSDFEGCTIPGDTFGYRDDAALPYNTAVEPVMLSEGYLVIHAGSIFYQDLALYKAVYEYEWLWTPTQQCDVYNTVEDNFCPWYKKWYELPCTDCQILHMDSWLAGTGDDVEDDIFCYVLDIASSQIVVMGEITDDGTPPTQVDTINDGYTVVCFDFAQNGDLWVLDNTDTMHHYVKDSSFDEATGDSFDLPGAMSGDVFDFAICWANSNFYFFTDNTVGGTIYRLSATGALLGSEPDALRMGSTNQGPIGDQADIEIDHTLLTGEVVEQEICRIMVGGGNNGSADYAVFARYSDLLELIVTWQETNSGISRPNGVGAIFFDSTNHYMWTLGDPYGDPLDTIFINSWWPIPDDW